MIILIVAAFVMGLCHPTFRLCVKSSRSGKFEVKIPLFLVTVVAFLLKQNAQLAFVLELAGYLLAGLLKAKNAKKQEKQELENQGAPLK